MGSTPCHNLILINITDTRSQMVQAYHLAISISTVIWCFQNIIFSSCQVEWWSIMISCFVVPHNSSVPKPSAQWSRVQTVCCLCGATDVEWCGVMSDLSDGRHQSRLEWLEGCRQQHIRQNRNITLSSLSSLLSLLALSLTHLTLYLRNTSHCVCVVCWEN